MKILIILMIIFLIFSALITALFLKGSKSAEDEFDEIINKMIKK